MTPTEAWTHLVAMHDADIDDQQNGRPINRHIIDTVEDAIDQKDLAYLDEFMALAKSEDIGPRYAISILRSSFPVRKRIQHWYALRDNTWAYMVKLDKPGRVRLMRGLMEYHMDNHKAENLRAVLPSYQQTKVIHGAKILDIKAGADVLYLTLDTNEMPGIISTEENPDANRAAFEAKYKPGGVWYNAECHVVCMPQLWAEKHSPEIGGYYVLYPDGYVSYSPAEPFEAGNKLRDVDWTALTQDNINHMFFQLRHNLNAIRWGSPELSSKVFDALMHKLIPEDSEITQVWIAGRNVGPLLEDFSEVRCNVLARNEDLQMTRAVMLKHHLFVDAESLYVPANVLIFADFKGQRLVRHTSSGVRA